MADSYYYNYLKNYILEVGDRIIGLEKEILEDEEELEEFLVSRANLAEEEFNTNSNLLGGCGHELAMQTLLAGLTELEPTEEEKEAEARYQEEMKRRYKFMYSDEEDE